MKREPKLKIRKFLDSVKDVIFGDNLDDRRYMMFIYIGLTGVFFILLVPLAGAASFVSGRALGCLTLIAAYIFVLFMGRIALVAIKGTHTLYYGSDSEERMGDDFSDIEALVVKGNFPEAINRYRAEFREREEKDERPRLRIAEIYWLDMKDYPAALNQFALIARTTKDARARLMAYSNMLEIFRDKMPGHDSYMPLCEKVAKEFPESHAGEMAREMLDKSRVENGGEQ